MFKKVMAFAAVAVLSCSVAFGAEFTVSNQFPPSHHISKAIHVFADKVVELSGGQLKVNVADSGSLYNDNQILEAVQDGLVEVGLVGTYKWGGMVPAADVFDLPFLFVDLSSPEKFLNAGAADIPGRLEIRFADAERDHVVHLRGDIEKLADARRLDRNGAAA